MAIASDARFGVVVPAPPQVPTLATRRPPRPEKHGQDLWPLLRDHYAVLKRAEGGARTGR